MTGWCNDPEKWYANSDGHYPRTISQAEYRKLDGHQRCEHWGGMVGRPDHKDLKQEPCLCPCHRPLPPGAVKKAIASLQALENELQALDTEQ